MTLAEAQGRATALRDLMAPYCARIEIAGSIRRQKAEVKDIELVLIPRWEEQPAPTLFGDLVSVNVLHQRIASTPEIQWIKPGTSEIIPWPIQEHGRYWRGLLPGGIKLDVFLCDADLWGTIYLIRTGSAEFSQAVMSRALQCGLRMQGGRLVRQDFARDGEKIPTPEEVDVFAVLGLQFVAPEDRRYASDATRKSA